MKRNDATSPDNNRKVQLVYLLVFAIAIYFAFKVNQTALAASLL